MLQSFVKFFLLSGYPGNPPASRTGYTGYNLSMYELVLLVLACGPIESLMVRYSSPCPKYSCFQSFLMETGVTGEIGTTVMITESLSGFEPRSKDISRILMTPA